MGRITENDCKNLAQVNDYERTEILYKHLVKGKNQKTIAEEVFHDYGDWASMRVSVVTRGYGFHNGKGKGCYPSIPRSIIEDFVDEYTAEHYDGGLDENTFARFLQAYRQQLEAQRQREAAERQRQKELDDLRRKQAAEDAERRRLQQIEDERRRKEWEAEQERLRIQREAERRRREEAERLERLRREEEERKKAALRQAAIDRGDHHRLMREGFDALKRKDYALARAKADEGWALSPLVGMIYIYAFAAAGQGDHIGACKQAVEALKYYKENEQEYWDLAILLLENQGRSRPVVYGRKLYERGMLSQLNNKGLAHLGNCVYQKLIRLEGGLRYWNGPLCTDKEYMRFTKDLSALIAKRIVPSEKNRALMLDCAYILTRSKEYEDAVKIYNVYKDGDTWSLVDNPAYDLQAHLGYCYYRMGDSSTLFIWFPEIMYHPHYNTLPLDALQCYGYHEILLELSHDNPEAQENLAFAQSYLDGEIPGSVFFGRYYGDRWRSHMGLAPIEDCRWCYDDEQNEWHLNIYTMSVSDQFKQQAKGFFGRLFGR